MSELNASLKSFMEKFKGGTVKPLPYTRSQETFYFKSEHPTFQQLPRDCALCESLIPRSTTVPIHVTISDGIDGVWNISEDLYNSIKLKAMQIRLINILNLIQKSLEAHHG